MNKFNLFAAALALSAAMPAHKAAAQDKAAAQAAAKEAGASSTLAYTAPDSNSVSKSSGFLSLIIDPSFVPAEDFKFDWPSLYILYGKSLGVKPGNMSWMFGFAASQRAGGAAGKLQYDFTSASIRPGAEISLFMGAGQSKGREITTNDGDTYTEWGYMRLAGGAAAGFFLKADVSRRVSIAGRLGASIKPLTVKDPNLSENMWLFYLGVEMQWRLF